MSRPRVVVRAVVLAPVISSARSASMFASLIPVDTARFAVQRHRPISQVAWALEFNERRDGVALPQSR